MAKIVIVGSSAAGFSACQTLSLSPENEIVLVSKEAYLPYKRARLLEYFAGMIPQAEFFLCAPEFFREPARTFMPNAEVIKVDPVKKRLVLKDAAKISYDYLIIASGKKPEVPDLPGRQKEGVGVLYSLDDVERIKKRLLIAQDICVVGAPDASLPLAKMLVARYHAHVKVICEECDGVCETAEECEVITGCRPQECIGEGELQALKLNNGKVLATDIALFVGAGLPATSFLKETDVKTEQGFIVVDERMRTNVEHILACGSVCAGAAHTQAPAAWDACVGQGVIAAEEALKMIEGGKIPCQTS
jgi:NAD(P)H-nitrite reductase large subunit